MYDGSIHNEGVHENNYDYYIQLREFCYIIHNVEDLLIKNRAERQKSMVTSKLNMKYNNNLKKICK